ncbi:hypothetical protein [Streptomyces sp. NBC_00470]|uniref:hypothetical protein n=1 Tax=Streptomyces sp. NBC_00470 TaxID=2975753 RepID=UPI002F918383
MIDIGEFLRECRLAVRSWVGWLGGAQAVPAFAADSLAAVGLLDREVQRLPVRDFEDWIALHTDLSSLDVVVLMETYGGTCRARMDDALPTE